MEELDTNLFEAKLLKAIILYDTGYLAVAKREFETLVKTDYNNEIIQKYLDKINTELIS